MEPNDTQDTQTPAEPDMIAQVGTMINRIAGGSYTVEHIGPGYDADDDRAVLVASAILAVAAELRAVRNELVDGNRILDQLTRRSVWNEGTDREVVERYLRTEHCE
jgi:hypothetical protein